MRLPQPHGLINSCSMYCTNSPPREHALGGQSTCGLLSHLQSVLKCGSMLLFRILILRRLLIIYHSIYQVYSTSRQSLGIQVLPSKVNLPWNAMELVLFSSDSLNTVVFWCRSTKNLRVICGEVNVRLDDVPPNAIYPSPSSGIISRIKICWYYCAEN